jgi:hypothetical protein
MFDRSAVTFVHEHTRAHPRYWLVVGKGPSADYLCRHDLDRYHVLTLNHACKLAVPTLAHFVDVDAMLDCRHRLHQLDCHVAMPWHPHQHFKAHADCLDEYPWAAEFGTKLTSYNATTANTLSRNPMLPTLRLRYFSAVAAFNILVAAGIRHIHSIGVDGGRGYAEGLDGRTRLANGQKTFDVQFPEIRDTIRRNKCTWVRLTDDPESAFEN